MKTPPAFPHSHLGIDHGQLSYQDSSYDDGMTLRDYFAAKAMQALIAKSELHVHATIEEGASCGILNAIAVGAYHYADSMLERRDAAK